MLGKNVQNELGAVNDLALSDVGQIVQLGGRKLAVEDQHARAALQGQHLQLRHLALAQNQARVDLGHALNHAPGHGEPGGAGQFGQFVQVAFLHNAWLGRHGNQQGARRVHGLPRVLDTPGQFFFQGFSRGRELCGGAVPGLRCVQMVGPVRRA